VPAADDGGRYGKKERQDQPAASQTPNGLMGVGDAGEFGIGDRVGRAEIGVRDAVMPGELVFVPLLPEKTQEESSCGKHIAGGAKKKLAWRRFFAGEINDA